MRVVTLNFWGDHEPLEARLDAAAGGLAELDPDVICLQEVRVGDGLANTAERLAARLGGGVRAHYAAATRGPAGTWGPGSTAGEEGLAILTRHPVSEVLAIELPEARAVDRRILLSARVDVAGRPVHCHTTHLHWRLVDGLAREKQVLAIDDALRARGADVPQILGGDFNAAPETDEIRFLCGLHTLAGRRALWQDAFARAHPGEAGWTWARKNPCTAAWFAPDRRIDYLFVSPETRTGVGRVRDARIVLDTPARASGVWPSDHFGVIADVAV